MSAPRLRRAAQECAVAGVDAVMVGPGADLVYLTGYEALPLERMTLLVVPASTEPFLVVPQLERLRAESFVAGVQIATFSETEDPIDIVRSRLGSSVGAIAAGDRLWAMFLLRLQQAFPAASWRPASGITRRLRMVKDAHEQDALARAGAAADRVAASLAGEKVSGRAEREVSRWIAEALVDEGSRRVNFAIVAAGENAASPHHEAGDRVIRAGDALVCDFGGTVDGYCSDITRTFHVGDPTPEFAAMYRVLFEAQEAGVDAVRAGVAAQDVDGAARAVIAAAGYGERFIHRTGHGIGLEEHEDPYLVAGNTEPLEEGMAFSVEPGIYLPGRFGARIEDIVVCERDRGRRLNQAPRELVVLG
ncbi:MAG: aminopeptidase P family protein [Actinomycetota bacterium]